MPKLSYRCEVCGWSGAAEPFDFAETAPCPNCGVYLYPLPWSQTWGLALLLIGGTVAALVGLIFLFR